MAGWFVAQPSIDLHLDDTPLFYSPSRGLPVQFRLSYRQRDQKPVDPAIFGVGTNWTSSGRVFLVDATSVQSGLFRLHRGGAAELEHYLDYTVGTPQFYDGSILSTFTARKGHGASLNGSPISVAQRRATKEAFMGVDLGYDAYKGRAMLDFVKAPWPDIGGLRLMGSATLGLTYVACGRLDAYIHPYLYPWDVAAAIALVEESGGKITDWQGKPATIESREILAANETLHAEFLR